MTTNTTWPFPMNKPATITAANLKKDAAAAYEKYRQSHIEYASVLGIKVVHIFDKDRPKGGLTVAFRKCMPHQTSTNMVEVAVATCSLADTFSRKIGTLQALAMFKDGITISLPLSTGHKDEDLNANVKEFFSNTAYGY